MENKPRNISSYVLLKLFLAIARNFVKLFFLAIPRTFTTVAITRNISRSVNAFS